MLKNTYICVDNLVVSACHGVNDFEKVKPQRFVYSLKAYMSLEKPCKRDDIEDTVSYAKIMKKLSAFCKEHTFDLIEKLAYESCAMLFDSFPVIDKIEMTLKKPDAPVSLDFENVSVSLTLTNERVYLSIGSSMGDKKQLLDYAVSSLGKVRGVFVEKVSPYIQSEPYGGVAQNQFLNGAVRIKTYLEPEELLEEIHEIEKSANRVRDVRWGDRTLDIDIVFFGKEKIDSADLKIPHIDYKNRDFVLIPILSLDSELSDPLTGEKLTDILKKLQK